MLGFAVSVLEIIGDSTEQAWPPIEWKCGGCSDCFIADDGDVVSAMQIWVDADACPTVIKEMLFRAAERRQIKVTLVANQSVRIPQSQFIDSLLVPSGMNVADRRIVELVGPGDLVVTADIPLAADVVAKGGLALDPRGELYSDANVGERVAVRNLLDGFRGEGRVMGGPANFNAKNKQAFANQLDRWLARAK